MKTTIDHAGRLVIPKDIRRESGIKPAMPLEVRWEKGAISITPAPLQVKLERKGHLLVAVPARDTPRLSGDTVERTQTLLLSAPKNNVAGGRMYDAVIVPAPNKPTRRWF